MADQRTTAITLAALELLPAEPSDLAEILDTPEQRAALLELSPDDASTDLTAWLCAEIDHGRVELWEKRLHRLAEDTPVSPVLTGEPGYPSLLASCWDRPPLLFQRGRLRPERRAVAVAGSRVTSEDVLKAAHDIARHLAEHRLTVVSGLAAGVDSAAHEGALAAAGHTVAVLGTGICRVFPASNAALAEHIAATGALLSQFQPAAPRTPTTFLRRNSVMAGLAHASLVMDGQERSGSRHQAEQAMRYGRLVLLWAPALEAQPWARQAVDAGAAQFVSSAGQVLAALGADR